MNTSRRSGIEIHFNPRSREGSDYYCGDELYAGEDFNPRSREGSDGIKKVAKQLEADFNPRSREGSDQGETGAKGDKGISIHAPAKGATVLQLVVLRLNSVFQSTLPRRERRQIPGQMEIGDMISIHAPAKGATAFINIFSLAVRLFFISSHQ